MPAFLDREEYIEQAYFFRMLRERVMENMAIQDILTHIHEEILSTTRLPMAIQFLATEIKHTGLLSSGFQRLPHYFTAFQTFAMQQTEDEKKRFSIEVGLLILEREALYRAEAPTAPGLFVYQFEAVSRNRLGYEALVHLQADPFYDDDWKSFLALVHRQVGIVDFADLVYLRSHFYVQDQRRQEPGYEPPVVPLFGEKEGKIAKANRGRDPLYLFAALQRQLNYPEVPRPKTRDDMAAKVEALTVKVKELETRLKLVEGEQRGQVDLSEFMNKPELLTPPDDEPQDVFIMTPHLQQLLDAFAGDLPLARACTIPSAWYHDPEFYALECQRVFGGSWQMVARADQLVQPGSFVTVDIAGEPILVVRDDQGVLRAFHNVCRHRAAQVINLPEGNLTKLRCRYHGWTYDLQGRLRGTPEFDGVEEFCKEHEGLVPLAVAAWGPLVFVNEGTPRQPLLEFLAPLPERADKLEINRLRFVERRDYEVPCNWKVYVDNYQDGGYHVNTVHPGLAGALDYAHYRTENFAYGSVQISPLKQTDDALGKVRAGSHANYWWVFPNLMINLYQGVMDTNLVLPMGPDRCRVLFDYYFADTESAASCRFIADSIAVAHQVQLEDMAVCAEVQRGLRSRSYDTGRFSVKREAGGYHFHQLLAKWLK